MNFEVGRLGWYLYSRGAWGLGNGWLDEREARECRFRSSRGVVLLRSVDQPLQSQPQFGNSSLRILEREPSPLVSFLLYFLQEERHEGGTHAIFDRFWDYGWVMVLGDVWLSG